MTRKEEIREIATKVIEELKYPHGMQMIPALEQMTNLILELTAPESFPSKVQEYFLDNLESHLIKTLHLKLDQFEYNDVREFCNRVRRWLYGVELGVESSPAPLENQESLWEETELHFELPKDILNDLKSKFILTRRTEGKGRTEGDLEK